MLKTASCLEIMSRILLYLSKILTKRQLHHFLGNFLEILNFVVTVSFISIEFSPKDTKNVSK